LPFKTRLESNTDWYIAYTKTFEKVGYDLQFATRTLYICSKKHRRAFRVISTDDPLVEDFRTDVDGEDHALVEIDLYGGTGGPSTCRFSVDLRRGTAVSRDAAPFPGCTALRVGQGRVPIAPSVRPIPGAKSCRRPTGARLMDRNARFVLYAKFRFHTEQRREEERQYVCDRRDGRTSLVLRSPVTPTPAAEYLFGTVIRLGVHAVLVRTLEDLTNPTIVTCWYRARPSRRSLLPIASLPTPQTIPGLSNAALADVCSQRRLPLGV
jgi:hypothetical protein